MFSFHHVVAADPIDVLDQSGGVRPRWASSRPIWAARAKAERIIPPRGSAPLSLALRVVLATREKAVLPIEEWDEQYVVQEIANMRESDAFERKGSASMNDRVMMAKEICAFANAGDGILVYGLNDGGGFDTGVPDHIGKQSLQSWADAIIPKLHHPPIENCSVRFLSTAVQGQGRGILAIFIPLSERRPHWSIQDSKEVPYLRVGEHSAPMRLQTLLDITSRGSSPVGQIGELQFVSPFGVMAGPAMPDPGKAGLMGVVPSFRVKGGPVCKTWAVEMSLERSSQHEGFLVLTEDPRGTIDRVQSGSSYFRQGDGVLFPGRWTRLQGVNVTIDNITHTRQFVVTLFLESAIPVQSVWRIVTRSVEGADWLTLTQEVDNLTMPIK